MLGDVDWIQLAQDRDRWRAFVNTVMNLRVLAPRRYLVSESQNCIQEKINSGNAYYYVVQNVLSPSAKARHIHKPYSKIFALRHSETTGGTKPHFAVRFYYDTSSLLQR
jgi:hypothetical protein